MSAKIIASACGLVLATMTASANAQDSSTTAPSGSAGQASTGATGSQPTSSSDAAKRQAEQVGMQDVQSVDGATVLQGTSSTNAEVFMIVGPTGDLLAIAAPLRALGQTGTATGETGGQGSSGETPEAGEPAQSGFMATQTQPATPGMWDAGVVENAMQRLELGTRGAAGEVTEQ